MGVVAELTIPVWTRGDKLRKSRETAGLSIEDMATALGFHRNSITAWESDRYPAKRAVVLAWAIICRVDPAWLGSEFEPDLGQQPELFPNLNGQNNETIQLVPDRVGRPRHSTTRRDGDRRIFR